MLDFEDIHLVPSRVKHGRRHRAQASAPRRIKRLPTRMRDGKEMGIFPLIAAAIPAVAGLAGSLLSKKSSKTGGPPPEAGQAQNVLDLLTKAVGGNEGEGENTIKEVVRNIVATVPSPVMAQVKSAISELKNQEKAGEQKAVSLVNQIDAQFQPQITAMLAALKAQQNQTQATYEHKKIVADDAYKKRVVGTLDDLLTRLNRMEQRLKTSAVVQGESRIALLGGRGVLER